MRHIVAFWRHRLREIVVGNTLLKAIAARLDRLRARLTSNPTLRLARVARAAHLGGARFHSAVRREFERFAADSVDWKSVGGSPARTDLPKAIILKPPVSEDERGVLHVAFEEQWLRLLRSGQAAAIGQRDDLLLGPSWCLPPDLAMLLAGKIWPNPVFTLLSHLDDAATIRSLTDRIIPVPLLASSWVNPDLYEGHLDRPRDYDLVMLANFASFKRHWLFFHTLRRLPKSYRVLLMGVPMGDRTGDVLREEARSFGVADRFDLIVKPTRQQVVEGLCRSRASLIFSRMEGSCIAVAESLFADTPVGLFSDARIGSRAFINEWTGRLLTRRRLAEQIRRFVEEADRYRARSWALEHISCYRSHEVLNDHLRTAALREGRPWTRDIVPMQNDLFPRYLDSETTAAGREWNDDFFRRYGVRIGEPAVQGKGERPTSEPPASAGGVAAPTTYSPR